MLGKQISFYMLEKDEDEFLEFVNSTGDVVILPQASRFKGVEKFNSFRELAGRPLGESCHLWNRSISHEPELVYVANKDYYWLDFMQSEVINVIRSKMVNQSLTMGRIHVEDIVDLDNGTLAKKSAEFLDWFARLSKWIKKQYPESCEGARLSGRAKKLVDDGVELSGHHF